MNEVLNNPMVIDILNKTGITLDTGLAECVRYTMIMGIADMIVGGVFMLLSITATCWLGGMGYKTRNEYGAPSYSAFGIGCFMFLVIPFTIVATNGVVKYLCPIGSMIQEVIK